MPNAVAAVGFALLGVWIAPASGADDAPPPTAAHEWQRTALPLPSDVASIPVRPRAIPWRAVGEAGAPGTDAVLASDPANGVFVARAPEGLLTLHADALDRRASGSASDAQLGAGLTVPSSARRGIGGTRLHASIAFLAPEIVNAGLFYAINDRWTVGLVAQRLTQERTVDVNGQLVDPNDLSSFIPGFSVRERTSSISVGPFVQYRLSREQGWRPDLSVAAYSLEFGTLTSASTEYTRPNLMIRPGEEAASTGDSADKYRTVFLAASKRLPWFGGSTVLQGLTAYGGAGYGARTGKRYTQALTGSGDPRVLLVREDVTRHSFVGWVGAELALPKRFSIYGEVFTGDECVAGYGAGLRWNSPIGITFTLGLSNCAEPIPQRALDLIYLPGGVGGQPSLVGASGGLDSGGIGRPTIDDEEERRPRR